MTIEQNKRRIIPAKAVRERCGDWSDMTLWRRLNEDGSDFPKPVKIARRRYWYEDEIDAWLESRADNAEAA